MNIELLKISFLKIIRDRVKDKIQEEWLRTHGCDSCCPRCKKWESDENLIYTTSQDDGSEHRQCTNCGYEWRAVFTPAGFIKIDEWQIDVEPSIAHKVIVNSLIEASRCLGIAQQKNEIESFDYWNNTVDIYRNLLIANKPQG